MTASLDALTAKVEAGERLSDHDIAIAASSRDIIALGMLASTVRRRLHGTDVTFVRVADLWFDELADGKMADLTVGTTGDARQADGRMADLKVGTMGDARQADGKMADLKVGTTSGPRGADVDGNAGVDGNTGVVPTFRSAIVGYTADSAGEVRILQTPRTLDEAIAVVEQARVIAGGTPLSAFCLFALSMLPEGLAVVLHALRKAGLETIAQAPIDRLGAPERAIESLADAGLDLARVTVAHTPSREWTSVCRDVAELQTRLRVIRTFAPLARTIDATQPTTGYEDVKRVALARVLADNVDTIQVDWALYGPKLAQVALTFGADDIDSVAADANDSQGRRRSTVEEIRRSIRAAGFEPVERDGRFNRRG
jgi:aminodeoxyfutalosine synthase